MLGLWVAQTEGAKFWLQVLTELKNRGVKDIFIAFVDGLKFPEAIEAVYPPDGGAAVHPWALPPHQDPVYRDPLKSTPNYVYVEIRNHGTSASTGTERLRLYWAKASTGLSWPTQWVDYQPGGPGTLLYGAEITKPRKNGATANAAEQTAYVNAILAIGTNPAYVFPMGTDFWHTQQETHSNMGSNSNIHETLAFLPWHREFVNRYEILLQQFDPTVKLLYWDWTTDPSASLSFMGSFSGNIGAPFNPGSGPTLAPPTVTRSVAGSPPAESDSAVLNEGCDGASADPCAPIHGAGRSNDSLPGCRIFGGSLLVENTTWKLSSGWFYSDA